MIKDRSKIEDTQEMKTVTPEPQWKLNQASRRRLFQMWEHMNKVLTDLYDERTAARKVKKLDDIGQMTEAIFHIKQAQAHLRVIAKHRTGKDIEDLEGYK